ncbi:MAG: DUF1285 domain-containing protein [Rhizobiales bacterium]|nr:DUF1285 domain-containing protein [Hyphomicrobiales bacterium]NRB14100.1 DUF1285 domain-containing protein [Hyphomicrobiales bacterium]
MTDILTELAQKIGEAAKIGHAPVEQWSPEYCGEIDLEIKANGVWHYMGSEIKRKKLIALFATVLWRDALWRDSMGHNTEIDDAHYLITPAEKIKIKVADVGFVGTDMLVSGQGDGQKIAIQTDLAGQVLIGKNNPVRFCHANNQFKAYVGIRYGLEAKLSRSLCYQLADYMVEINGKTTLISDNFNFTV